MKKIYIATNTEMMGMEEEMPLAASVLETGPDTQSIIISEGEADTFTSRRGSVWDDDDDFDF